MNKETVQQLFSLPYIEQKMKLISDHIGQAIDFKLLDDLRANPQFVQLRKDVRNVYLFCLTIRSSIDKNKSTHTSEIFGQMLETLIQLAQNCDDFTKEVAFYDPDCILLRMSNQLDYAKELKTLDEHQLLTYTKAVDELYLNKTNFQAYHNLDAMLFNILTSLCEIKGVLMSNKTQIKDFIEFDKSNSRDRI
jgi:hypothetical protein